MLIAVCIKNSYLISVGATTRIILYFAAAIFIELKRYIAFINQEPNS